MKNSFLFVIILSLNLFANTEYNFTEKEKAFINSNQTIKLSSVNWEPLVIIENNKMYGLLKDYKDLVAKVANINFEYVPSKNFPHVIELFKQGKIDLLTGDENALGIKNGFLTKKFIDYPLTYVSNEEILYINSLEDVKDKTFALPKLFAGYNFVKKNLPNAKIIETKTIEEALLKVSKKEADVYLGHKVSSLYSIEKLRLSNLRIAGKANYLFNHHFIISEKYPELFTITSKIIEKLTDKERNKIYYDWVHIELKDSFDYSLLWKGALVIFAIFIVILYYNKKLKKLVNQKTLELRELNENLEIKVKERTAELAEYKKHTSASIEYASMIQESLLPINFEQTSFFKESFAIWEPKDIVGGDIFIFQTLRDKEEAIVMVIDCTGHGIPGAFMTMLFKAFEKNILSTLILNQKEISPAEILQILNREIKTILKQENKDSVSNAGLDAGILYFDKKRNLAKYAGAEIPLFYIKDSQINIIKGDRQSVGYRTSKIDYIFTDKEIELEKDSYFYLSSDGYYDQNGGEKSFCFGKKRFKQILLDNHKLPMYKQKEILKEELISYQNKEDRNDDITVIGLKL